MTVYLVAKTIKLTRYIEATTQREACNLAFDMGDIDTRASETAWHVIQTFNRPIDALTHKAMHITEGK